MDAKTFPFERFETRRLKMPVSTILICRRLRSERPHKSYGLPRC